MIYNTQLHPQILPRYNAFEQVQILWKYSKNEKSSH